MQDEPTPAEILTAVAAFLREAVVPQANPLIAFQARVAANAVDLAARQIALAPLSDAAEAEGLCKLLSLKGTLADLNTTLAEGIYGAKTSCVRCEEPRMSAPLTVMRLALSLVSKSS